MTHILTQKIFVVSVSKDTPKGYLYQCFGLCHHGNLIGLSLKVLHKFNVPKIVCTQTVHSKF